MALELATAYVSLSVSSKGIRGEVDRELNKSVAGADKAGKKAGGKFKSGMSGALKGFGAGLVAGLATDKVVGFFRDAQKGASDLEQSVGGVQAVFKDFAPQIEKSSKGAAQSLGLTRNEYNELATTLGAGLKNKGFKDFGEQTQNLIGIGSDLSAQFGGSTQEAVDALASAMRGEMDPIEKYGISLNEAALKAEAVALGLSDGKGALTESAKAQASLSLITKQSADAQGAFARESDTAAGKQARFRASMENLKTTIGEKLLPVVSDITGAANGFLVEMEKGEGAGGKFKDIVIGIKDALVSAVEFVVKYKDQLIGLGIAVGTLVVAQKAYKVATMLATLWTKKQAIMQALLNRALMMNPIGLIVAALVALGVGLVVAYKKSETFRRIVDGAWAGIKRAAAAAVAWFKNTGWPILKQVFAAIGSVVAWLWNTIYKPYFTRILGIAKTVFGWIKNTGWPLVKSALSAIGSAAATLWSKWIKPNFERMKSGVSRMVDAFRKAKDGIGRVWSGIKDGVRKPIDAVMGFLRDKFVGPLNTLLSKIPGVDFRISLGGGAKKVGGRSGAQRYASGGVLPGYSPGRDNMHWVGPHGSLSLSGGEAIMRPEWTRAVGTGFVHQMNALARRGGVGAVRNALGFAKGGIIDDLKKRGSDAFRIASAPMRSIMSAADVKKRALAMLGGIGSNGFAQAAAGVARKAIDGIVAKVKQLTQASAEGVTGGMGGRSAGGGWQRLWAIVKTAFPGAVLTSSYRPGSITASGNRSYHSMGRAIDVSPSMAIFNYMRKNFGSTLRELIYSPAGGAQIKNGRPYFYQGAVRGMHWDHVHIAAKNGGIVPAVFDNGGTLAPGLNLVHNKLGRPEPLIRPEHALSGPVTVIVRDDSGMIARFVDGRIDTARAHDYRIGGRP